jgi:hypothetical protein
LSASIILPHHAVAGWDLPEAVIFVPAVGTPASPGVLTAPVRSIAACSR